MLTRLLVQLAVLIVAIIAAGLIYFAGIHLASPPKVTDTNPGTASLSHQPLTTPNPTSTISQKPALAQKTEKSAPVTDTGAFSTSSSTVGSTNASPQAQGGPIISINFDDDFESGYKYGVPIMHAAGFKTTQYIITRSGGSQADLISQVNDLHAHGDEIAAHTRTHPRLSKIPLSSAQQEIDGSKADLQAMGYVPVTFAYPYGDTNPAVEDLVKKAGFAGARSTNKGFNDRSTDPFMLLAFGISNSTTVSQVERQIDEVEANKKWLIFVIHRVDEPAKQDDTTHQLLQQMVNYIASKKIPVVTNAEGLRMLKNI